VYGIFLIETDKKRFEMTNNRGEFSICIWLLKKHPESIRDKLCVAAKRRL